MNERRIDTTQPQGAPAGSRLWRGIYELVRATTGRRLQARVRFLELTAFGGEFEASSAAARRLAPEALFDVVEHAPGRTQVSVLALDYRIVDRLSPYHEVALSIPVRYRNARAGEPSGSFVFHMPVTTEEARWGGVELYGFPKVIADIRHAREDDTRVCSLEIDGQHVLTLRAREHPVSVGREHVRLFTVRDDARVIGSSFDLSGEMSRGRLRGDATLELGEHPIARSLRALELSEESVTSLCVPHGMAELSKGRVLGRVPRDARISSPTAEPLPAG